MWAKDDPPVTACAVPAPFRQGGFWAARRVVAPYAWATGEVVGAGVYDRPGETKKDRPGAVFEGYDLFSRYAFSHKIA